MGGGGGGGVFSHNSSRQKPTPSVDRLTTASKEDSELSALCDGTITP